MPTSFDPLDPPTWPGLASRRPATVTPDPDRAVSLHDAPTPLLDAATVDEIVPDPLVTWSAALAMAVAAFLAAFPIVVSAGVLRALID